MSEKCNHEWKPVDNLDNLFECENCNHMKLVTTHIGHYYGEQEVVTYNSYLKPVAALSDGQLVVKHEEYEYEEVKTLVEEKE